MPHNATATTPAPVPAAAPDNKRAVIYNELVASDNELVALDKQNGDLRAGRLPSSQIDVLLVRTYELIVEDYVVVVRTVVIAS